MKSNKEGKEGRIMLLLMDFQALAAAGPTLCSIHAAVSLLIEQRPGALIRAENCFALSMWPARNT